MSALHWFEIPVTDIKRATEFYETILAADIAVVDMTAEMASMLGILPNRDGAGGALVQNSQYGYIPSKEGTLVYLQLGDIDLNIAVDKVVPAGGEVLLPQNYEDPLIPLHAILHNLSVSCPILLCKLMLANS